MRVAVIGAGPAGLFMSACLARRGHEVHLIDRDPGPTADGSWPRRGVMQFHHAHGFRFQVVDALRAEMPNAYDAWLAAGAEPVSMTLPDGREMPLGVRSTRPTYETALRAQALNQEGVHFQLAHVDRIVIDNGHASGVVVDGAHAEADLVIDASGRSGRATRALRPAALVGGDCGVAYVDRVYQLRPGAELGPLVNPIAFQANFDGYMVLVFPHERGMFSVVIIRSTADRDLVHLRHAAAFDAAAAAIPSLAAWTDPDRAEPITSVLPGGTLKNVFRGQTNADGELVADNVIFVGDAVCTTTPNFGRGIATTMLQCVELLRLLDEDGRNVRDVITRFDDWCAREMRPWVEDHVRMDDSLRSRWDGKDIDPEQPLSSDLIMEAAQVDPSIMPVIGPYAAMRAGPGLLRTVEPAARAVYRTGWRPSPSPGPTRAELAEVSLAALQPAG
jgi:2-polyprenyl-6-methoxyphenol hydroxylase-like FAD-dependent oxidoreductase